MMCTVGAAKVLNLTSLSDTVRALKTIEDQKDMEKESRSTQFFKWVQAFNEFKVNDWEIYSLFLGLDAVCLFIFVFLFNFIVGSCSSFLLYFFNLHFRKMVQRRRRRK